MKKCPYCAEMIQAEAIKCRYCFSDLRVPPDEAIEQRPSAGADSSGAGASEGSAVSAAAPDRAEASTATSPAADAPGTSSTPTGAVSSGWSAPPSSSATSSASVSSGSGTAVRYTHSGYRYVLGYGSDFFGVWDRQSPSAPAERFPRTDEGWRQAWIRFADLEPNHVAVPGDGTAGASTPTARASGDTVAEQYTHSGTRYLLGYGKDFFGIWDRQDPSRAVERFPRTDEGWADAWRRYTEIEPHFSEVSLGSSSSGNVPSGS